MLSPVDVKPRRASVGSVAAGLLHRRLSGVCVRARRAHLRQSTVARAALRSGRQLPARQRRAGRPYSAGRRSTAGMTRADSQPEHALQTAPAGPRGRAGAVRHRPPATLPRPWSEALELLLCDLRRRDAAQRTRRAYAVDVEQFARWAAARGWTPDEIGPKALRRYVAHLSEQGIAPASSARKLAALRALFASQREHGRVRENPAELVSRPRRASRLPRV